MIEESKKWLSFSFDEWKHITVKWSLIHFFLNQQVILRGDKGDAIPPLNPPVAQRVLEKL